MGGNGTGGPAHAPVDARTWYETYQAPALGRPTGAEEVAPAPDGRVVAFAGVVVPAVHARPYRRLHLLDPATGTATPVGTGTDDRCPQWSPDGQRLAYVGGAAEGDARQPVVVDRSGRPAGGAEPAVDGVAEYVAWSPDGTRLLVGVADHGADVAGASGSGTLPDRTDPVAADAVVEQAGEGRRRLVVLDPDTGRSWPASPSGLNVWEAAWSGAGEVLAIVSARADEGGWYGAYAATFALDAGGRVGPARLLYRSDDQLGLPACSPSGWHRSVVRAVASDRGCVQGDLMMLDRDGCARRIDTRDVDVTDTCWRTESRLVFAGIRGLDAVAGEIDVVTGRVTELWVTEESLGGGHVPRVRPATDGTLFSVLDGHARPPTIVSIADGRPAYLLDLGHEGIERLGLPTWRVERRSWTAPDGLGVQGLLSLPPGPGPFPLVLNVHGGPVAAFRDRWLMSYPYLALLLARGYAVLQPNPRGSSGRGQDFARLVKGDMNGADTFDLLSGVDALVAEGVADPARLAVTGGSYGGNMTAWLVTQDSRFAAAVPWFPHTDYVSFHFSSNIPEFDELFLASDPLDPTGRHVTRSAFRYTHRVRTPVLQIVGGQDRCCPPSQALHFHRSLVANGVESVMVTYPEEGHGIRGGPALPDSSARVVAWFERHLAAAGRTPVTVSGGARTSR